MMLDHGQLKRLLRKIHAGARRRAVRSHIAFDLDADAVEDLWWKQRGRCAVSGVAFNDERFEAAFVKHPYSPSLDRVDPARGYTQDNVRLVCTCVNFGMGQWGEEVLRRVAVGMLERERERPAPDLDHEWMQRQQAKLRAAEKIANSLTGEELKKQRQRIAGLKRSITLGPEGLRRAAAKAHARRHTTTPA